MPNEDEPTEEIGFVIPELKLHPEAGIAVFHVKATTESGVTAVFIQMPPAVLRLYSEMFARAALSLERTNSLAGLIDGHGVARRSVLNQLTRKGNANDC